MTVRKRPITLFHAPGYHVNLGSHVFPTAKYDLVRERLLAARVVPALVHGS